MKLLYYLHTLSIGGSQRSSLALAKEMRKQGCDVVFAGEVQGDAFAEILDREGFKYFDTCFSRKPGDVWRIARRLSELCSEEGVDVCHAYYYTTYYFAWTAKLLYKMPVTGGTFCGGPGPRYHIPRLSPIVVFSEEQRNSFVTRWGWRPDDLVVSPARIEHPVDSATTPSVSELMGRYGLSTDLLTILFVSRLSEDKRGSIEIVEQLAREVAARSLPWQVLIAGGGELEGELRGLSDQLEHQTGRQILATAGEQKNLVDYYACADIIAGVGRSIFDGMIRGKPAMVVGENGFAGMVSPDNVKELAYYNFSGRNTAKDANVEGLIAAISSTTRPDELSRLGDFARGYAADTLSVEAGGEVLSGYYERLKGLPQPSRAMVLREVALSTISYVRRKGLHA